MRLIPTEVNGSVLTEAQLFPDERGSFTTIYDRVALEGVGITFDAVEDHLAHNARSGTLRGLHFQQEPSAQAKLVRCLRGRIYDVTLDLRRNSPTYLRWAAAELREGDGRSLFVPVGCAHGYLTLEDHTDVLYYVDAPYDPGRGRGVRWNDPAFGIDWPARPVVMTARDAGYPDYQP
jgi:dTDP-4-dehydrorhamnose 3,5-epimerase